MSADTGPSALPRTEAERIKRLERIVSAIREGEGGDDIAEILKALAPLMQNGNGTRTKVAGLVATFSVCGIIGGFMAVEVINQGKAITALQTEVQQCIKVKP